MPELPETTGWYLSRHRDGDRDALGELFRRVTPLLERVVWIRLGAPLAARYEVSDIVQETLVTALERIERFECREDARFIDWLSRLAERKIHDTYKFVFAEKRDPGRERTLDNPRRDPEASAIPGDLADSCTSVVGRASRAEAAALVDECVASLPEDQRDVILWRSYAGGRWRFVAERLDRSPEAAQQLFYRAQRALAEEVGRRAPSLGTDVS